MDHVVSALAVLDRSIEKDCEQDEHERQHNRVALVEGVLFDAVVEEGQRYNEAQVQKEDCVPLIKVSWECSLPSVCGKRGGSSRSQAGRASLCKG